MGKHKSDDKKNKKKKSSQLVIRIDAGERDAFVKLCDTLDTSAAREIRRFMRDWVAAHGPQPDAAQTVDGNAEAEAAAPEAAVEAPAPSETPAAATPAAKGRRKRVVEATA